MADSGESPRRGDHKRADLVTTSASTQRRLTNRRLVSSPRACSQRLLSSLPAASRGGSGPEGVEFLEHVGDQCRDLRTLRAREGHMGEEIVALELLDRSEERRVGKEWITRVLRGV